MNLTKNVMQLNNISVGVGKIITFEDVVFDDSALAKYIMPSGFIRERPRGNSTKNGRFKDLFQTYRNPIEIETRYSNGAKYLYGVFPFLKNNDSGNFMGNELALGLASSSSSTTPISDVSGIPYNIALQDLSNGRKHIKHIGVDENIVKNAQTGDGDYDLVLSEVVLDLKYYYDKGVRYIWIQRVVNETVTVNGYSVTPVNTIAKPVAYFIYEN